MEEFILIVSGSKVQKLGRASPGSVVDNVRFFRIERPIPRDWKIVKVYQPISSEGWLGTEDVTAVEIGYHEQRLTALERLAVKCFVSHYWDIPF